MLSRRAAALGALFGALLLMAIAASAPSQTSRAAPDDLCNGLPCWTLTFSMSGNGSGHAFTTDGLGGPGNGNIDCVIDFGTITDPASCSLKFKDFGSGIFIHYTIASEFGTTWCASGSCYTNAVSYGTPLTANTVIGVTMDRQQVGLSLNVRGAPGRVEGPNGLVCNSGDECNPDYLYGDGVTLNAIPGTHSVFVEWTGYCAGQNVSCLVPMFSDRTTTAWFGPEPTPTPKPSPTPHPTPTKSPSPTHTGTPKPTASISGTSVTPAPRATAVATGLTVGPTPSASASATTGVTPNPSLNGTGASPTPTAIAAAPGGSPEGSAGTPLPSVPAATTSTDSRPLIFLAVFVLGLLVVGAIAVAYRAGQRRSGG